MSSRPVGPIAIEGTFVAFDFGMAFDFGVGVVDEGVIAIGKFNRASVWMPLPIAAVNPFPPFSGMAEAAPFGQFPKQFLVHIIEDFFGGTSFVVVGPTSDNGIEFANQGCLTMASILTDDLFEVV